MMPGSSSGTCAATTISAANAAQGSEEDVTGMMYCGVPTKSADGLLLRFRKMTRDIACEAVETLRRRKLAIRAHPAHFEGHACAAIRQYRPRTKDDVRTSIQQARG